MTVSCSRIVSRKGQIMNEKKVKVLLSAYNGEKYIQEQVDSILQQTYTNLELYIRDDGSKDRTLKVLEQYENDERVHVIQGENKGFIKSFFELVRQCGDADYFAFADQDDVWLPEKMAMAVEMLEREDRDKPLLYFSNYDFYDGQMNFKGHGKLPSMKPSFHNAVVDCLTLGFNSVFNKKAHDLMAAHIPQHSCGHDWWTYMVCSGMGEVIFDERVTVKYRRHEKNVSAGGMDFIKFQIWRFKKFFVNDYFSNIRKQMQEFYEVYAEKLSWEDRKLLYLFSRQKYSLKNAFKKVFYPKRFRCGILDEMFVRFICLIGKL